MASFLQNHHIVNGDYPATDIYGGNSTSDIVSLENYQHATFIFARGAGTGSATVTVESCDDTTPTTSTAIAFRYRTCASSATVDTWGDLTDATSAGVHWAAAANGLFVAEVDASELSGTDKYVRLVATESDTNATVGHNLIILSNPRYPNETPVTAIT